MKDIRLFINGQQVEFKTDPQILFNYKVTELQNPTIIRNSFSKSIEIPSTPTNDNIFNHFWNLERVQEGSAFNAMLKVPFTLYYDSNIVESGYAKLDTIKGTKNNLTYSIVLYGSLGEFLYNLNYADGASDKKTLASLIYTDVNHPSEPDLNFIINKETINDAWDAIMGTGSETPDDKWNVINFAPCYNGKPDYDADKVLINNFNLNKNIYKTRIEEDKIVYTPYIGGQPDANGYSVGELSEELTEWETFDLRSYMQRPVVSVKRIINACTMPENNGGWQVMLDSHFFNSNNPYYEDAWMTLPMLKDLEVTNSSGGTITGATITRENNLSRFYNINYTTTMTKIKNVKMRVSVHFNGSNPAGGALYTENQLNISTGLHLFDEYHWVKKMSHNSGVIMQLYAMDVNGNVVAVSNAVILSGQREGANGGNIEQKFYKESQHPDVDPQVYKFYQGHFRRNGSDYVFCDTGGHPLSVEFTLNTDVEFGSLQMKIMTPFSEKIIYAWAGSYGENDGNKDTFSLYQAQYSQASGNYTASQARALNRVTGSLSYVVDSITAETITIEDIFSNTAIPRNKLLKTSFTPSEFLISYCKLFGLYLYRDPSERSSDEGKYPKGVIHIYDRDTFYTEEFMDLKYLIDYNKTLTITPTNAASKWYRFAVEPIESQTGADYKDTYGSEYGSQMINTGYNFDSNTTDLYDGNVFKSGVMVREKDKYFVTPIDGIPVYTWNGMKYSLFHRDYEQKELNSYEIEQDVAKLGVHYNINNLDLDYFDALPKLQCHTKDNEASDGSNVLLFFKGMQALNGQLGNVNYWITDDLMDMISLNDGVCHILTNDEYDTNGNRIAIKTNILPSFTRDLINFGVQEGNIVNSWNFGHPMATFVPNTYTTKGDSIYDKSWKSFINDVYDVDSRKLQCYVRIEDNPKVSLLRKYFWFDNSIWRLNEIKDWNISSNEPVLCEFIKVKDTRAYTLSAITSTGIENIVLDQDKIAQSGGTITGTIYLQSGGRWYSPDDSGRITGRDASGNTYTLDGALTPYTGSGENTPISIVVPANWEASQIIWDVRVEDDFDNWLSATFVQEMRSIASLQFVSGTSAVNVSKEGGYVNLYYMYYFRPAGATNPTMTYSGDWIRPTNYTGPVPKQIKVYFDENTDTNPRTATITLTALGSNGETLTATATITQEGRAADGSVSWDSPIEYVESGAGQTMVGISWDNIDTSTLTASTWAGYGNYKWARADIDVFHSAVTITYEENDTIADRTIEVDLYGDDFNGSVHSAVLMVHQENGSNTIDVEKDYINWCFNRSNVTERFGVSGAGTTYTITIQDD